MPGPARTVLTLGAAVLGLACAPKAPPLPGAVSPVPLPRTELPPGYRRVIFRWTYADADYRLRGEGVARLAAPDSVRLDLFLDGGLGAARAILIGDELRLPDGDLAERLLPPPPLMWAALGRLATQPAADTVIRVDGDTLRADIGRGPVWRSAFVGGSLRRLERIDGGRVREWVTRDTSGSVRYELPTARRVLDIAVLRSEPLPDLDAAIWR